ncbi:hypothetical protein [Streptomyces sp. TRM49041]|uniref:hypothetical protein n=1 Tax=Streptomyces sp. TRM49041 TaxID=2603216 RepID=UPI0011EF9F6A|nr:hypothetical protein [Streptomyces sp. TRM49041]
MPGRLVYESHPLPFLLVVLVCLPVVGVLGRFWTRASVLVRRGEVVAAEEPQEGDRDEFTVDGERYRCLSPVPRERWNALTGEGWPEGEGPRLIVYDPQNPRRNESRRNLRPARLGGWGLVSLLVVMLFTWAGIRLMAFIG